MRCVILQPSYLPWRGYFDLIRRADVFVFYDDVQFDKRGWRNRNRIKTPAGSRWLTVPVHSRGHQTDGTPIHRIPICWDTDWAAAHRRALADAYRKAPYFSRYTTLVTDLFAGRVELLADLTIATTMRLARELGIERTTFRRSSEIGVDGRKTDRLLALLRALGASHYLTGPSARSYLDEAALAAAGIAVEYITYDYPEYPQLYPPYDPHVSVLDLLFMTGPEAPRYIWPT